MPGGRVPFDRFPAQACRTHRWTEAAILEAVVALHTAGLRISHRSLVAAGHSRLAHAIHHFGGFLRVRQRAGISQRRCRAETILAPDAVLEEIRRRHDAQEPLAASKISSQLQYAARRHFGSWAAALEAVGVDYEKVRIARQYSDDQLFEILRSLAGERPHMTVGELNRHRIGSTLRDRFGSAERAARLANLQNWPKRIRRQRRSG